MFLVFACLQVKTKIFKPVTRYFGNAKVTIYGRGYVLPADFNVFIILLGLYIRKVTNQLERSGKRTLNEISDMREVENE